MVLDPCLLPLQLLLCDDRYRFWPDATLGLKALIETDAETGHAVHYKPAAASLHSCGKIEAEAKDATLAQVISRRS